MERNRSKVAAFHSRIEKPLPENVKTMWRRSKPSPSLSSVNHERSDNETSNTMLPPKKSRSLKSQPDHPTQKTKHQRSRKLSTSPSCPSTSQRLLDTYFAPTTIPTLDPTQAVLEPKLKQCAHNATSSSDPIGPPSSKRNQSKVAKRSHEAQVARARSRAEEDGAGETATARSSSSSCVNVTCSCTDNSCHDVSDIPACDFVYATIKSPGILSCPLALPGSTNSIGCSRRRRVV